MAGSLNKVQLIGNLGADPEVRSTQNGNKVVTLSIATSESWRDKNTGERQERTEWHRVVIWNEALGGIAEQYLKKGSKAYVEGQLQTRKWQDQDGHDRYSTEVVLSGFGAALVLLGDSGGGIRDTNGNADRPGNRAPDRDAPERSNVPATRPGARRPASSPAFDSGSIDDDIPF